MITDRWHNWMRFAAGGGINTLFTYAGYLFLQVWLPYQVAFLLAYILGIAFSYLYNAKLVFRVPVTWRGLITFPLVYVVQYAVATVLLGLLVEIAHVDVRLAPLIIVAVTLPLTYGLSKCVLARTAPGPQARELDVRVREDHEH